MAGRRPDASEGTMPMLKPKDQPLLMVIDGHALVHRSYRAISVRQNLTVSQTGEDITAVYGFSNTFLKALQDWTPTHCAIAFDLPTPTFRHKMFADYKAQRPETPQELRHQFDRVKQLMRAFNVPVLEKEGYEGDDIIGSLAKKAEEWGIETIILTGDTDTFQLVSPWVRVALSYSVQDQKVYDENEIRLRYGGLGPESQTDLKALKGDTSDNIPGVPGIGDKTAIKLLSDFGTLEGIYENLDKVTPPRAREALGANREQAFQGKVLTTIVRDVPLDLELEDCRFWTYDRKNVVDLFRELEFSRMVSRIPDPSETAEPTVEATQASPVPSNVSVTLDYQTVDTQEKLDRLVEDLSNVENFAFDTETTGKDPMSADLVGLSFSTTPGRAWYVPVGHSEGAQIPIEQVLAKLKPLFESDKMGKTAHNANYDVTMVSNYGITPKNLDFDTMIAAHILGRKALGLKNLALEVLDVEMTQISQLIGSGRSQITMAQVPAGVASEYACADADMTGRLRNIFEPDLHKEGLWDLFCDVELPLIPVLVAMERRGICADAGVLHEMSRDLDTHMRQVETDTYNSVGHVININSPQQLSDLLFNELKLPKSKRTKTGYSTDANSLEALKGVHPVIDGILEYRQLSKLKSTYVDALPELINRRTGRLHTSYNQTGSATGRVSSSDPNLQNIPIRTELGRQVRKAFYAENQPDWTLLSADYSQIELRVLAHLSQDPALLEAFQRNEDIHSATASLMYQVPLDSVNSDMRRIAKVLNFGVIYGLSSYGISQQTEFSPDEGQKFIENYFASYPEIRLYLDTVKEQARELGYVTTILGRRRIIPDIHASNYNIRQAAERAAVNMPIQGTAADIMKLAMIRVHRRMEEEALKSRMLLQVHDELVFEVPMEEVETLQELIYQEMPAAMDLSVPLNVDVKKAYTWGDLE